MLKRSNPTVAKPATVLDPQKLLDLGIHYGTNLYGGQVHLLMSEKNWQRATRAKAVVVHEYTER